MLPESGGDCPRASVIEHARARGGEMIALCALCVASPGHVEEINKLGIGRYIARR